MELVHDVVGRLQLVGQLRVGVGRVGCLQLPGLRPISLLRALQPAPELSCHDRVGLLVQLAQLREICVILLPAVALTCHLLNEGLIVSGTW